MTEAQLIPPQLPAVLHVAAMRCAERLPKRSAQTAHTNRGARMVEAAPSTGRVRLALAVSLFAAPKRP
ncbi:hypothetical protein Xazr_05710 [Xanthomonas campestris pv. azadirachtae]|nr:hypothetical protein Xazr_05710 [Xanthomonas campestris pv. azadirachtae]